jgi:hypothetical protein
MGCDDSDVPGHAPRYLDVRPNIMKISSHVWYLAAIGAIGYVALINVIRVNELSSGNGMYVANMKELQETLTKAVSQSVESERIDYSVYINKAILDGKISVLYKDALINKLEFSKRAEQDKTNPIISFSFSIPQDYYDRKMDGVTLQFGDMIAESYFYRSNVGK